METTTYQEPLRIRFAGLILRSSRRVAMFLPERLYVAFFAIIGRGLSNFLPGFREREIMDAQLAFAGVDGRAARDNVARDCIAHAAESMAEVFIIPKLIARGRVKHGDESEILNHHSRTGQGVLVLSGHIGNFELLAASHAHRRMPLTVIGRRPNYSGISSILEDLRKNYGAETIWRDEPGAAKKLIRAIRTGHFVGVLPDQDTSLDSVFPPFFGIPAACPVGPVRLSVRMGVLIVSSFIIRLNRLEHRVFTGIINYDRKDPDAETKVLTEYHRRLEALILEYPDQWLWWHRRWRREPGVDYRRNPELLRETSIYVEWLREKVAA